MVTSRLALGASSLGAARPPGATRLRTGRQRAYEKLAERLAGWQDPSRALLGNADGARLAVVGTRTRFDES
jgi:hypothetical protein